MKIKRVNFVLAQRDYWRQASLKLKARQKKVKMNVKEQIIEKNRRMVCDLVH